MTSQELLEMALTARAKFEKGPITCAFKIADDHICGKDPIKYYKHLKRHIYIGFCEDHSKSYPEDWAAFKPVSKEEVVTHEVMDS